MKPDPRLLEHRCSFELTLRFEPFFALEVVTDAGSRIHGTWSERALASLPRAFEAAFDRLGRASSLWPIVPDVLEPDFVPHTYGELRDALARVPEEEFRRRLLGGVLHEPRTVNALLKSGSSGLTRGLGTTSPKKREWLAFVGLYPPRHDSSLFIALRLLLDDTPAFRASLIQALDAFWSKAFEPLWNAARRDLLLSIERRRRLLSSVTFAEFARDTLLRVDVRGDELRAVRGGYRIAFDAIRECRFVPSLFNDRRYWHAYDTKDGAIVHFPYFEPALALPEDADRVGSPEVDPALVFRALGDATRYAMATLLARRPMAAIELTRALSLSKPTVSHHVAVLREAGLLRETPANGSINLSLRREVLEQLSSIVIDRLFDSSQRVRVRALPRSRRTQ
jgi:DNA-binding transcriptional ArsR family regulator